MMSLEVLLRMMPTASHSQQLNASTPQHSKAVYFWTVGAQMAQNSSGPNLSSVTLSRPQHSLTLEQEKVETSQDFTPTTTNFLSSETQQLIWYEGTPSTDSKLSHSLRELAPNRHTLLRSSRDSVSSSLETTESTQSAVVSTVGPLLAFKTSPME